MERRAKAVGLPVLWYQLDVREGSVFKFTEGVVIPTVLQKNAQLD